jgi:hypothetical protein
MDREIINEFWESQQNESRSKGSGYKTSTQNQQPFCRPVRNMLRNKSETQAPHSQQPQKKSDPPE